MNIDKMIKQWEEKHSSLLNDYNKGNANNELMQMYRSQMKNILDFINELKQIKNNTVLDDVNVIPLSIPYHIYIALEDFKCKKYGGVWEQMDKQVAFVDGQCAAIEFIEEWLRSSDDKQSF